MKVEPSKSLLGAMISDIDLKNNNLIKSKQLQDLLHQYKVLTFVDQELDCKDIYNIGSIFGEVYKLPHYRKKIMPDPNYPDIQMVERNHKNKYWLFGGYWHSDNSHSSVRPEYTCLYCVKCPLTNGETEFIDQVKVYNSLSQELKDVLNQADVNCSYTRNTLLEAIQSKGTLGFNGCTFSNIDFSEQEIELMTSDRGWNEMDMAYREGKIESVQPCILKHPHTQELYLNINPSYSLSLSTNQNECLEQIFNIQKSFERYKLEWKPNMLTIWDNRLVIHRAIPSLVNEERLMYRIMIQDINL